MSRKFWNWIYLFIFFLPLSLCGLSHINMTTADHNVSNETVVSNSYNVSPVYTEVSDSFNCILVDKPSNDVKRLGSSYNFKPDGVHGFQLSATGTLQSFKLWVYSNDFYSLSSLYVNEYWSSSYSCFNYIYFFDYYDVDDFSIPEEFAPYVTFYSYSLTVGELFDSSTETTLTKWFDYEDDVLSVVDDMGALLPVSAFYKLIFSTPNIWLKSIFLGADLVIWASVCHIVMDLFMLLSHSLSRLFAKFGGAD